MGLILGREGRCSLLDDSQEGADVKYYLEMPKEKTEYNADAEAGPPRYE